MISSDINQEMEEVVEGRRDRYIKATNFCHKVPLNATCECLTPTNRLDRERHISHLSSHFSHQSMESMSPIRRVSENQAAADRELMYRLSGAARRLLPLVPLPSAMDLSIDAI